MKIEPNHGIPWQPAAASSTTHAPPAAVTAGSEGDLLQISDQARERIAAGEAGVASMEQAVRDSRQQARRGAVDKVSQAHQYLKLLQRMSLPDDPAAAREAARIAREINGATGSYRAAVTKDELVATGSDAGSFVSEAGEGLAIARNMVERYLSRKKNPADGKELRNAVNDAYRSLNGLVRDGMATGLAALSSGSAGTRQMS